MELVDGRAYIIGISCTCSIDRYQCCQSYFYSAIGIIKGNVSVSIFSCTFKASTLTLEQRPPQTLSPLTITLRKSRVHYGTPRLSRITSRNHNHHNNKLERSTLLSVGRISHLCPVMAIKQRAAHSGNR